MRANKGLRDPLFGLRSLFGVFRLNSIFTSRLHKVGSALIFPLYTLVIEAI